MFESLESRTLYSTVMVTVHKGLLKIVGTPHRDRINVSGVSGAVTLTINGHTQTVQSRVRSVYFYGGNGSDTLNGSLTHFNYYVEGGAGNDSIYTGPGLDTVFGGRGNDTLADLGSDVRQDYQDGGPGDDHLSNGGTMHGGSGHDTGDVEGPSTDNVFASGLEAFNTYDEYDTQAFPYSISGLMTDVSSRKGRLVLVYRPRFGESGLNGPFIRDDGRVGFIVRSGRDVALPTASPVRFTLNARYTKYALSRGLVISYDDRPAVRPLLLPTPV